MLEKRKHIWRFHHKQVHAKRKGVEQYKQLVLVLHEHLENKCISVQHLVNHPVLCNMIVLKRCTTSPPIVHLCFCTQKMYKFTTYRTTVLLYSKYVQIYLLVSFSFIHLNQLWHQSQHNNKVQVICTNTYLDEYLDVFFFKVNNAKV